MEPEFCSPKPKPIQPVVFAMSLSVRALLAMTQDTLKSAAALSTVVPVKVGSVGQEARPVCTRAAAQRSSTSARVMM